MTTARKRPNSNNTQYAAFYECWAQPKMSLIEPDVEAIEGVAVRVFPKFKAVALEYTDDVVIFGPLGCASISLSRLCATPLSPFEGSLKFRDQRELYWTPLWIAYKGKRRLRIEERRVHQTWRFWAMLQRLKATSRLPCAPDKLPRVPRPLREHWDARAEAEKHLNAAKEWLKKLKPGKSKPALRSWITWKPAYDPAPAPFLWRSLFWTPSRYGL